MLDASLRGTIVEVVRCGFLLVGLGIDSHRNDESRSTSSPPVPVLGAISVPPDS